MRSILIYGSGAAVVVVLLVGAVLFSNRPHETPSTYTGASSWQQTPPTHVEGEGAPSVVAPPASPTLPNSSTGTIGIYTNTAHRFSLSYPKELQVKEFDEGGGAQTVVFQKPGTEAGFQIFIIPYTEEQISEERLEQDLQGGAMREPVEVTIGNGIRAVAFWSTSPIIGESREVWFIRDGYLYEFTTYATLDAWFASVMATLRFN